MTREEIDALKASLQGMADQAFKEPTPEMTIVYAIAEELKRLNKAELPEFRSFVEDLKNRLFHANTGSDFLDLSSFQQDEVAKESIEGAPLEAIPVGEVLQEALEVKNATLNAKGFHELFIEMIECLENELVSLKGYFTFHLLNDERKDYIPLILHDGKCFFHSVKKKLESTFAGCQCKSIEEFANELKLAEISQENYAVILILSTKINDRDFLNQVKDSLSGIVDIYRECEFITLKPYEKLQKSDFIVTNDKEGFLEEVEFVTSTFLTNADLSNDEEKLIKSLFKHLTTSPILEYKILKGGKSGSKVLEVKPKMNFNNEIAKRFVAKFAKLDADRKIRSERQAYSEFVESYSTPVYDAAHYERTANMEGMKYSYASKDAVQASFSFSTVLDDSENRYHTSKLDKIGQLFNSEPFKMWMASIEKGTFTVADLYQRFINEAKFIAAVKKVKCLSDEEVQEDNLVKTYQQLLSYSLETNKKVCHGDLHSENFFIDQTGIYLIDFGFTGILHSLVDHTALECSMKFKHVPSYIEMEILSDIENQLTSDASFDASFQITTSRKDLTDYFNIINKIRVNSDTGLCANPNSRLEYLISLFVMTCRQIQYADLNQLYALRSAEIIGERIKQLIA